jgi:hypothetical protein
MTAVQRPGFCQTESDTGSLSIHCSAAVTVCLSVFLCVMLNDTNCIELHSAGIYVGLLKGV